MGIERSGQTPKTVSSDQKTADVPSGKGVQSKKLIKKGGLSYNASTYGAPGTDNEADTLKTTGPQRPAVKKPSGLRNFSIAAANSHGGDTTRGIRRDVTLRRVVGVLTLGISEGIIALSVGLRDAYRRRQANWQIFRDRWMENNRKDLTGEQKDHLKEVTDEQLREFLNFRTRRLGGLARRGFNAKQRDVLMHCVMSSLSGGGNVETVKDFVSVLNKEVRKPDFEFDENAEVNKFKNLARKNDENFFVGIDDMILISEPDEEEGPRKETGRISP